MPEPLSAEQEAWIITRLSNSSQPLPVFECPDAVWGDDEDDE